MKKLFPKVIYTKAVEGLFVASENVGELVSKEDKVVLGEYHFVKTVQASNKTTIDDKD